MTVVALHLVQVLVAAEKPYFQTWTVEKQLVVAFEASVSSYLPRYSLPLEA